jgi:hypothetical protein
MFQLLPILPRVVGRMGFGRLEQFERFEPGSLRECGWAPRSAGIRRLDGEGRLAQRESIGLTSRGPQVQILYRPPQVLICRGRSSAG